MQALIHEIGSKHAFRYRTYDPSFSATNLSMSESSSIIVNMQANFPDNIAAMFQKLNRIKQLQDNWDSYQAEIPSANAIEKAYAFLFENSSISLPFYFLAPGVNGEIMIEFQKENKAAELYFLPNGSDELVFFENDDVILEGNLDNNFQDLINFFRSHEH